MRISDWSSDVCSSDLLAAALGQRREHGIGPVRRSCPQVAEDQVLVDGEVAEHLPPLRNIGNAGAGDRERRLAVDAGAGEADAAGTRSEEHTSELQSLMRISYAVFCLKKKQQIK